jgi:hypothetical protein
MDFQGNGTYADGLWHGLWSGLADVAIVSHVTQDTRV